MNEFKRLNSELEKQCHILREMLQTFPSEVKASEVTSDDYWKQFHALRLHFHDCLKAMDDIDTFFSDLNNCSDHLEVGHLAK